MQEFLVPSSDPGIDLYVRNKCLEPTARVASDKVVLFVHGSTYPAETSFDLPLGGLSWMDYIAGSGYDVYLMDVRGYGRSTRPPEMDEPAMYHAPIVRTETAVRDFAAVIDFIRARRRVDRISLMGWSWGTTIAAAYTACNNAKVNKLVLYAPQWLRTSASLADPGGTLGSYREVTRESARTRWLNGVPDDKADDLIPSGWFDAWAQATFATDPRGAMRKPPVLRAPNGVVQDNRDFWAAGKTLYEPADIRVPTLLVHAEWDVDTPSYMLHGCFAKLVNAPYKRYVEIGEGTHSVMMEKNRMQLFQAVQQFLDEDVTHAWNQAGLEHGNLVHETAESPLT